MLKNAIDYLYAEWNNKAVGFVSYGSVGGARAVEHLRLVAGELQMVDVRQQLTLSPVTEFENYSAVPPRRVQRLAAQHALGPGRRLEDADLVFTAEIRHLLAPARDARARGQLLHEYEETVLAAPKFYEARGRTERLAASAPGLAGDYQAVTRELLGRMQTAARNAVSA